MTESNSNFVGHEPCPACGSSDALARYDDGHGYCWSCSTYDAGNGEAKPTQQRRKTVSNMISYEVRALVKRGITEETCKHFSYGIGEYNGKPVQVANYITDGERVAQKLRFANKDFTFIGEPKDSQLYGQHLWRDAGKMVVITEGEIDCLSVSQLQANKWPVVSVQNGAQGATKSIKKSLEWLERFETVVFMFDNDEPGIKAAKECAALLTPGRAKIATLPLKDANEMLVAGRGKEVIDAIWGAKAFRPDGIVTARDLRIKLTTPIKAGLSWPWSSLTTATYGIRTGELYTLGAGTGMGKSEVFKEVAAHLITEHKQKVGVMFLEETPEHSLRCIAGKIDSTLYHLPDVEFSQEAMLKTCDAVEDMLPLYDSFGYTEYEVIKARMRYLAVSLGAKYIVLDHITALVTGDKDADERRQLDFIMTDLASMVRELDIALFLISHLSTPEGKSHEEGGRVMLKHFRGSRAIGQWSNFVFGLERDQQDEDESKRHTSIFRVLKDRYTGRATGLTFGVKYDQATGRLNETNDFADESTPTKQDF